MRMKCKQLLRPSACLYRPRWLRSPIEELTVMFLIIFRSRVRSMKYSNLPGHDEADEYRSLNSGGTSGSEAFV